MIPIPSFKLSNMNLRVDSRRLRMSEVLSCHSSGRKMRSDFKPPTSVIVLRQHSEGVSQDPRRGIYWLESIRRSQRTSRYIRTIAFPPHYHKWHQNASGHVCLYLANSFPYVTLLKLFSVYEITHLDPRLCYCGRQRPGQCVSPRLYARRRGSHSRKPSSHTTKRRPGNR